MDKIKQYLEICAQSFQKHYPLSKNLRVDETLLHFKGKVFKVYLLCDNETFYLYNMYFPEPTGKDYLNYDDHAKQVDESIVLNLISFLDTETKRNLFLEEKYVPKSLLKKLEKMKHLKVTVEQ